MAIKSPAVALIEAIVISFTPHFAVLSGLVCILPECDIIAAAGTDQGSETNPQCGARITFESTGTGQ